MPATGTAERGMEVMDAQSTHELLVRFKHGNIEAFQALYGRYWSPFRSYGFKLGLTLEEASDAAQNAFARLIDRISTYREKGGGGERWLWRIGSNSVLQVLRTKRRDRGRETGHRAVPGADPHWFERWLPLGPEFVWCLLESFAGLSPKDQLDIRNRGKTGEETGSDPKAYKRWREALRCCYDELDQIGERRP